MTNLKAVTEGFNKFCGPAVLSILTGKSTDECAAVITRINGQYNVTGVLLTDLLRACDRLGFDQRAVNPQGSLFRTLTSIIHKDGMYIVTLDKHFVCVEVKDKKIYFCDNHTKEPIPAASSARLSQNVVALHQVIERERVPEPPKPIMINDSELEVTIAKQSHGIFIVIDRVEKYNIGEPKKFMITHMTLRNEQELKSVVHSFIAKLNCLKGEI